MFLSGVIQSSLVVSDDFMVFSWKKTFFIVFVLDRKISLNNDGLATISLSLSHCIVMFVSSSSVLKIVSKSSPKKWYVNLGKVSKHFSRFRCYLNLF